MSSPQIVRFGVFELDRVTGELRKGGVRVKLQDQPFRVLAELTSRPKELVTREELREKLWPGDTYVDFDQNLNAVIKKVRQALGDSSETPRFIETLPKRGYRFIYPVEGADGSANLSQPERTAPKADQDAELSETSALETQKQSPGREAGDKRFILYAGLAAAVGAVILIALWQSGMFSDRERDELGGPTTPAPAASVAVLPLENLSGDPEQEYFADGMTDMLITDLGTVSALRVISRTSVMQYKGARKPLAEIGRELDVSHLMEGTVLREGDEVRIGVRLMEAGSDRQVWGQSYERSVDAVLPLQREIARAVADAVQVALDPSEQARLNRDETVSPEALDAFLRGFDAFYDPTKGGALKALELHKEAARLDPSYAAAYDGQAACYVVLAFGYSGQIPPKQAVHYAKEAVMKALELDDRLVGAYNRLGTIRFVFDWDWPGAERAFRRAQQVNPNDSYAHYGYADVLASIGRTDEAVAEAERGVQLDPRSPLANTTASGIYGVSGNLDKALYYARRANEILPQMGRVAVARVYLAKAMYAEAIDLLEESFRTRKDNSSKAELATAYARAGQAEHARSLLSELLTDARQSYVPHGSLVALYVALGEPDEALDRLERAYEEREPGLVYIKRDPVFEPLRSHPRFQALIRKMNFPE